jgi:rhamnose utilization protein RhaD (predicted bifunctional aldolase and dehydrogenase)/NAD(P)-dependent dehydrogenase (short-subunit alcohol dehydrogenase family)
MNPFPLTSTDWTLGPDADLLDQIVLASRLLGSDPSLVLHGGGNTSIKAPYKDITGEVIDAIYVKGSGWDLGTIERPGFAPLPLARLHALLELTSLSDPDMVRELSAARLDPDAPQPSVEALLHAFLEAPAVLHSHADLVLTITNLPDGPERVAQVFGPDLIVVPYVMPGFDLAVAVRECWAAQATPHTIGMVLMAHGLFTFGDTCQEALERHRAVIERAETYLATVPAAEQATARAVPHDCAIALADLRRELSLVAGRPMILSQHCEPAVMEFVARTDLEDLATRGPLTPDHVIRTKRIPMVGRDFQSYARGYTEYFDRYQDRARTAVTMLDPAPRVILDPELGMITAGIQAKDAAIGADIYHHTIEVLSTCEDRLGGWSPLEAHHLFDVEYWDLEQAKLRRSGPPPALAGQVALVTGAASGIGKACAQALLAQGAAVVGWDLTDTVTSTFTGPAYLGLQVDVTEADQQRAAIETAVRAFGGLDIAVMSAGIFGRTATIADLDPTEWSRVLAVNLDAVATGLSILHPLLKRSPVGGRVVMIGSKNVPAPGAGAAAYSASKAALTQLARVAALEWASDRIRVNTVHPDAVFDTGLWSPELLAERAAKYQMSVQEYTTRNLLRTEVTSALVAQGVLALVGPAFAATTGAQIPIDGGSDRTI